MKPKASPPSPVADRKFLRIAAPPELRIKISETVLPKNERNFDVLDIGVYGLSFAAPATLKHIFKTGVQLSQVDFSINKEQIRLEAQIVYVRELHKAEKDSPLRVGVEFTHTDSEPVWILSRFIAENADAEPEILEIPRDHRKKRKHHQKSAKK